MRVVESIKGTDTDLFKMTDFPFVALFLNNDGNTRMPLRSIQRSTTQAMKPAWRSASRVQAVGDAIRFSNEHHPLPKSRSRRRELSRRIAVSSWG
jgi:hypothetical protein